MLAMLRTAPAFGIAILGGLAVLASISWIASVDPASTGVEKITAADPAASYAFLRDNPQVHLPKASQEAIPIPTSRTPDKVPGVFSGNFYGAFETSWFQADGEPEIWFLVGNDSNKLWSYFETDRVIPYGPDHPEFDPNSSRPIDHFVYPYVCVRTQFEGRLDWGRDVIHVDRVIAAEVINLPIEKCIPASGEFLPPRVPLGP